MTAAVAIPLTARAQRLLSLLTAPPFFRLRAQVALGPPSLLGRAISGDHWGQNGDWSMPEPDWGSRLPRKAASVAGIARIRIR